ncbi:Ig-like domain-containing protein [Cohnella rhizosphaerae]|uniref:Ig-like domain-containing protein n=1 Tax=Cohnella rhizosphaerae TaxID=1457232 RepID=A0A9X4L0P2_9BACL|nr:Ig-like domain-containing protein [Cohnella rhizosphaerae]MDG0814400.1 Ig-like domain-containing protein [Cohnella rhizosphaerae]
MMMTQRPSRSRISKAGRLTAALMAVLLFTGLLSSMGAAVAATTVTSVKLDELSDIEKTIYVDDGSLVLLLWATTTDSSSGGSSTTNVTNDATWVSSNSAVSVSKGVVTATGEANNVVITGKYQGYSASVTLTAKYHYSELKLRVGNASTDAADKLDVQLGQDILLKAKGVNGSDLDDLTDKATWTSSDASVVSVDKGKLTINAAGKTTITAKYQGRTDTIELTATSPYKSMSIADGAGVKGPYEMQVGEAAKTLAATAKNTSGSDETVTGKATWKSSNEAVATVDETGKVTPVAAGTATITATYLGVSATATIAVRTPFEAILFTPSAAQHLALSGAPLEITAKTINGSVVDLDLAGAQWESTNLNVISVSGSGAKATVTPRGKGTATIKLTYKSVVKELSVTVYPTVSKIELAKDKLEVYVDDTGDLPQVKGTALDDSAADVSKLAKWTSSDNTVVSIDDEGKWTALKSGKATLTATVSNGAVSSFTDTLEVTVSKKVLTLLPEQDNVSLIIGQTVSLPKVTAVYEDGDESDISADIVWKSASTSVLVKDASLKGLVAVKTTLTGTYLNKTIKVTATVEEEYVSYTIEPSALSLTLNKSQSVKVTGKTKSGKLINLSSRMVWTSEDETIAAVKGSSAKSLAEGATKLTAKYQGKSLSVPVTVKAKLTKLTVSDTSLELAIGATDSVKVTAVYENGRTLDVTAFSAWTASSTKVAKVTGGVVTAVGKGSVTVKAAYGGKTVNVRVKVK